MSSQGFARWSGLIYLLVGALGFIPGLVTDQGAGHPGLSVQTGFGYLLGLFPINVMHNLVHLAIGGWGLVSSRTAVDAVRYARGLAIVYGILAIMGLIPGLNTMLGLAPLFGHDIWLHALTAGAAAYFGYYWTDAVIDAGRRDTRRAA